MLSGSRELEERGIRGYYVMGTLGEGQTVAQAQTTAATLMRELAASFPSTNGALQVEVVQFWRASRGPQGLLLQGLSILQGIMLILLLAVCGNTANLMLARATTRHREIGVLLAVGAGRGQIARKMLIESVVLGLGAATAGAIIAMWGSQALRAVPVMTTAVPVRFQTGLNEGSLMFAIALGAPEHLETALIFPWVVMLAAIVVLFRLHWTSLRLPSTPAVRRCALGAASRFGDPRLQSVLVQALNDPDASVQKVAAFSLSATRDPEAGEALVAWAGGHRAPVSRRLPTDGSPTK